jgi:hypothetical protein
MPRIHRRSFIATAGALGASLAAPTLTRAQATTLRWGESLAATHPQVQMGASTSRSSPTASSAPART